MPNRINFEDAFEIVRLKPGSVLETMTRDDGTVQSGEGYTDLYVYPGYSFKSTDDPTHHRYAGTLSNCKSMYPLEWHTSNFEATPSFDKYVIGTDITFNNGNPSTITSAVSNFLSAGFCHDEQAGPGCKEA